MIYFEVGWGEFASLGKYVGVVLPLLLIGESALKAVRDFYFSPFYLVSCLNAPSWVDSHDKRHRRTVNRINGAGIFLGLNLLIWFDLWALFFDRFSFPIDKLIALALYLPLVVLLSAKPGQQMVETWCSSDVRYRWLTGVFGVCGYAIAIAFFFAKVP